MKLNKILKISSRSVLEFLAVIAIIVTADPTPLSFRIGVIISVLGLCLRIIAAGYKFQFDYFMVRGPYRYVRHPHFLGNGLILLGLCIAGRNSYVSIAVSVIISLFYTKSIHREEEKMEKVWGSRYRIFKANVSAIIPQLIPVVRAGGEGKKYSFKNALLRSQLKEVSAFLSIFLTYLIMYWAINVENMLHYYILTGGICCVFLLFRPLYYSFSKRS